MTKACYICYCTSLRSHRWRRYCRNQRWHRRLCRLCRLWSDSWGSESVRRQTACSMRVGGQPSCASYIQHLRWRARRIGVGRHWWCRGHGLRRHLCDEVHWCKMRVHGRTRPAYCGWDCALCHVPMEAYTYPYRAASRGCRGLDGRSRCLQWNRERERRLSHRCLNKQTLSSRTEDRGRDQYDLPNCMPLMARLLGCRSRWRASESKELEERDELQAELPERCSWH